MTSNNQILRKSPVVVFFVLILTLLLIFPFSSSLARDDYSRKRESARTREFTLINFQTQFAQANTFYEKGDFEQAVALYQQIIAGGYESGNLYYNLGNSYFKLGRRGMAILYYEKAKRLIPGDADLKANLSYTLNAAGVDLPDFRQNLKDAATGFAPLTNMFIISSFFFFLVAFLLVISILFPVFFRDPKNNKFQPLWLWIFIICGGLLVLSVSATIFTYADQATPQAIVIKSGGTVYFEPKPEATVYYSLNEGSKVQILSKQNAWSLIKRQDGKRGWIESSFLEGI